MRTACLLKKLASGSDVHVAVFGGSFTAGHGCIEKDGLAPDACAWPARLERWFASAFPESRVHFEIKAEGGTDSSKVLNDITHWVYEGEAPADLVILDLFVNDQVSSDDAAVSYEALIRSIITSLPHAQLLLIEDGGRDCLKKQAMLSARRKLARHYGLPVVDYAAMVQMSKSAGRNVTNVDELLAIDTQHPDMLWPLRDPDLDPTHQFIVRGTPWPHFLPHVRVVDEVCCPENHPPWPVHQYMADAVGYVLLQMLGSACRGRKLGTRELPAPSNTEAQLARYPTCRVFASYYSSREASGFQSASAETVALPDVLSGDWILAEDVAGKPGWIATAPGSTISFPVFLGQQPVLAVSYLRSYEGLGHAKFTLVSPEGSSYSVNRTGIWEHQTSMQTTDYFTNASVAATRVLSGGASGDLLQFIAGVEGLYHLQVTAIGGKFKLYNVASC